MYIDRKVRAGAQLYDLLDLMCQEVEPTDTQFETAKQRYETVGTWLAGSLNPFLAGVQIYAHGSFGLGTAVKPLSRLEYDVDLICFAPSLVPEVPPADLKQFVGERLRENGRYREILQEKPRCWRLNYANEFHLDVTPAIKNPACRNGGELVHDKHADVWKPSNPKGYCAIFEARARLRPRLRLSKAIAEDSVRAGVEEFPEQAERKGPLRRTIQVCKRHRDLYFQSRDASRAPISIVITTLAARAYAFCATHFEYDTAFDLLIDVVSRMPYFIDETPQHGKCWVVYNESTAGENFAEKWNSDPSLAVAFFAWHRQLLSDLAAFRAAHGLDELADVLGRSFGSAPVSTAMGAMRKALSSARSAGTLSAVPAIGLVSDGSLARATPVPRNTFFGR